MTKLQKIREILVYVLDESPVDFLGTGGSSKIAAKEEKQWREMVTEGIFLVDELIEERK